MKDLPHHIWVQMTEEEKWELAARKLSGQHIDDGKGNITVLMGMNGFKRIEEFQRQMTEKYER